MQQRAVTSMRRPIRTEEAGVSGAAEPPPTPTTPLPLLLVLLVLPGASATDDWLLAPAGRLGSAQLVEGTLGGVSTLSLSNGLVSRVFALPRASSPPPSPPPVRRPGLQFGTPTSLQFSILLVPPFCNLGHRPPSEFQYFWCPRFAGGTGILPPLVHRLHRRRQFHALLRQSRRPQGPWPEQRRGISVLWKAVPAAVRLRPMCK
eukprot:SAG31_NODE_7702_length_1613_cov_1.116248_2_plen_204_part_00